MFRSFLFASILLGASAAAGAATPATAAAGPTLSVVKGTVMVNNGSQFVTAKTGQALRAGDRVMVMDGGTATLTYADGSKSTVSSGTMFSVDASASAAISKPSPKKIGPMYAQAVGDRDRDCHDDGDGRNRCDCHDDVDNRNRKDDIADDNANDKNDGHIRCAIGWYLWAGAIALADLSIFHNDHSHEHPVSNP